MCDEVVYLDTTGRKRTGVLICCLICGKLVPTRKDQPAKYCSVDCSRLSRRNRLSYLCARCGKEFERAPSKEVSKSKLFFCSRKCKDDAQRLKGGMPELFLSHYGTGTRSYRSLFEEKDLVCRRCGYDEFSEGVDIHHIDENRNNNDKSNLIALCSNCHRGLHAGRWKLEDLGS